jgi:5-methylthioadenosine/S-adenosylhomocysteine deaminase
MNTVESSTTTNKHPLIALAAEWILPMTQTPTCSHHDLEAVQWLEDHAIIVEDRKILDVLPKDQVFSRYPDCEMTEFDGMALMPGLINAHCHAAMSLLRGYSDDLPLHQWLETAIWPVEAQFVDDEFVYQGTQLAIAEMLRGGTTCFQDMYFMPDQIAKAAQQSGIRANIGLMVVDSETVWARDASECISKGLNVYDQYKHNSNLTFSFAPHAPYTVSPQTLEKLSTLSFELSLNIHMHLHETAAEVFDYQKKHDIRPLEQLHKLGLLNPQLNAVHMTQLNDQEISWLAETGTHVIHCPQSNMKLASGCCPTGQLLDAGVNLAIGTDGAASNNDLDMLAELQSAALLAKIDCLDPEKLSAYQALYAATMGGAKALGLENEIGSLEPGKQADVIAIDLNQIETQPVYNPVSQIVYAASRNQVTHVWVAGKHLLNNRQLTSLNESSILNNARSWKNKIMQKQNSGL